MLIEVSIGVEVTDPDALVKVALAHYYVTRPENTPARHVEEFKDLIRTDPAFALHQLFDPEDAVREISGVRYVAHTGSQRTCEPDEPFPWSQRPSQQPAASSSEYPV